MEKLPELGVRNSIALLVMIFIMAKEFRPKIIRVNNGALNVVSK